MKKIVFRMTALIAAMMMTLTMAAKTQDWGGRVIDEKGEPMPYVNVVLLSLPDSAFVQGATTDMDGVFKIVTDVNQGLFKVTSVGYQTLYINAGQDLTIQMKEDTQLLSEVVVKGQLPKTHVKGDAMRTTVAGTILEKAGTVSDALSKIPSLEAERDGGVKVLGRGDAEVYINGRKVQDMKELSRLRSDQIQHVDVVQNPGARYAASVKAVVRITLKKAQGDGLSFQNSTQYMYQYGGSLNNNFVANYRTGGLDVTGSFWVGTYNHYKGLQVNDMLYYVGKDQVTGHSTQEIRHPWHAWSPQLQLNYMVNENHTFGAYYKYDRTPSGETKGDYLTDMFENGILTERSASYIWQDQSVKKHIFNAYYNGKVGELGIDLNIDGLFDDTKTPGRTTEKTTVVDAAPVDRAIESNTNSANNFWASKLIFSYPVMKGNLSVGGEYSYNHRTDAYTFQASDYVPVKATDTEINEKSSAIFVEYGRQFGKVFAQAGLRYEHLTNDYFNFGVREDEVCRNYGDWFPTATLSAPIGKMQLSLSYRRDIQRPAYSNLTSSTIYVNRYTYQSGNPYLLPTYNHSFVLNAAYQWANLTVEYGRMKNSETMSTEPFPGSTDPLISLVRPINSADDYNQFELSLSARPTIGCWHPMWYAFTIFQNYKTPTADGTTKTLNDPYFTLVWNNDIELPHSFRLSANAQWATKGDYNNFSITAQRFNLTLGVQRDFNLRCLGQLTLDVRCVDVLNTNKTAAVIYGIRELSTDNPARRTFLVNLNWKFNEARSKYRGSGAGEKQKARM
ncbi:MAG: outer membrane beta-barrel protein [Prevotella sp.]|nr:outer membrane beta-barrel protein [Prevotella sp.]